MDPINVVKRAIIVLMVFFGLFTAVKVAEAATFLGQQKYCSQLAIMAESVARELRDDNVEWSAFEPWLLTQLLQAVGNGDSFIKDESDVTWVLAAFKQVWDGKQSSYEAAVTLERNCMKTQPKKVML